jgi:metal transporter CNNM
MWYIAIVVGLVLLGGLFSGLTLGLMGLDSVSPLIIGKKTTRSRPFPVLTFSRAHATRQVNLQVLSQSGTPDEQRQAPKVLKLLRAGRHTMLVVLLLGELGSTYLCKIQAHGRRADAAINSRKHPCQHFSARVS